MKTQSCVFVAFRTDWPKRRRIAKLEAKAQGVDAVVAGAVIQMADLKIDEDLAGQALGNGPGRFRPVALRELHVPPIVPLLRLEVPCKLLKRLTIIGSSPIL